MSRLVEVTQLIFACNPLENDAAAAAQAAANSQLWYLLACLIMIAAVPRISKLSLIIAMQCLVNKGERGRWALRAKQWNAGWGGLSSIQLIPSSTKLEPVIA